MAIVIKPFTFVPGTVIRSSEVNLDFDVLYNLVNGNIDNANIAAAAAIALSKLQSVAPGQVLMGNGGGVITPTTLTGNITISPTGVVTVTGSGGGPPGTYNNSTLTGTTTVTGPTTFSGTTDFSGPLLLPTAPPLVNRSAALVGGVLQIHDGTAARSYLRTDTYNTQTYAPVGGFAIGTANDAVFVDADAVNAAITFTVAVAGTYMVSFMFDFSPSYSGPAAPFSCATLFRLSVDAGAQLSKVYATDVVVNSPTILARHTWPVSMICPFVLAAGAHTIRLQKRNLTSINVSDRRIGTLNSQALQMIAYRIAD